MAGKKLFACDFEISGKIPEDLFENFTQMQASLLGLHGYMKRQGNKFRGRLEGDEESIKTIRKLLREAEKFKALIEEAVFTEIKEIQKYTKDVAFEVKK